MSLKAFTKKEVFLMIKSVKKVKAINDTPLLCHVDQNC